MSQSRRVRPHPHPPDGYEEEKNATNGRLGFGGLARPWHCGSPHRVHPDLAPCLFGLRLLATSGPLCDLAACSSWLHGSACARLVSCHVGRSARRVTVVLRGVWLTT